MDNHLRSAGKFLRKLRRLMIAAAPKMHSANQDIHCITGIYFHVIFLTDCVL